MIHTIFDCIICIGSLLLWAYYETKVEELEDYKRKYNNILKGEQNNERY